MAGPKIYPKGSHLWKGMGDKLSLAEIIKNYEDGYVGSYHEPEEEEAFAQDIRDAGGWVEAADAATEFGLADSGKDQLSIPFVFSLIHFPGCLPGPAQERGDCVSHDQKNANMASYACEIQSGLPDAVTGKVEEAPEISSQGLRSGAFSTEVFYWFRRHGGDGWSCDAASRVSMKEAGLVPRADYSNSGIGIDLTTYSGRKAGRYGRTPPSGSVADALDNNLIRQATNTRSREERRDMISNGYCISTCGSEGWSNKRDENGHSKRKGTWYHAMAFTAFDDRPSTHTIYGDSLELVQNSWARWNSGPRDIRDSASLVSGLCQATNTTVEQLRSLDIVNPSTGNIMIPKGSFWARSRDVSRRRCIAKGGVNGWPKRDLWVSLGTEGNV